VIDIAMPGAGFGAFASLGLAAPAAHPHMCMAATPKEF
jgi:hypothetical protein